ncbi:hypothetical protein [Chitiniphilus shinanonensis]|uniref:hypothetical protein n=1 Tax=Chitiniphilus shinanonensis TaxID=553088 RepID=UPI0030697F9E
MNSNKGNKGTIFGWLGITPKTTGKGTRPALSPFQEAKTTFTSPDFKTNFPIQGDDNQRRLLAAMHSAHDNYHSTPEQQYGMRNGHINEFRQYEATLTKYNKMTQEEKDDRVYLPQMRIFKDHKRDEFRIPDMVKLKRTQKGSKATITEFKSKEHEVDQRLSVMKIISKPSVRATLSPFPNSASEPEIYQFNAPITKYKTLFSSDKANPMTMSEPHPTRVEQRDHNTFLTDTDIQVINKKSPSR